MFHCLSAIIDSETNGPFSIKDIISINSLKLGGCYFKLFLIPIDYH